MKVQPALCLSVPCMVLVRWQLKFFVTRWSQSQKLETHKFARDGEGLRDKGTKTERMRDRGKETLICISV